jgi:tyrosinase
MLVVVAGMIGAVFLMGPETRLEAQLPVVRQEVNTLSLNSPTLVTLRKAVLAMKALPRANRRNWFFVANIHGYPADSLTGDPLEAEDQQVGIADRNTFWATCQHASEFFLPWHRAELLTYERIVRELSGDPKFALPYWDAFANSKLPEAFRVAMVDGKPNPTADC